MQRTWLPSMRSTASRKKKQTAAGDTGITSLTHEELTQRFFLGLLKKCAAEFEIHRPGGALLKLALQSPTMASLQSQCQVQITRLAYVWLFDSPCFRTSQQPRARFNAFLLAADFLPPRAIVPNCCIRAIAMRPHYCHACFRPVGIDQRGDLAGLGTSSGWGRVPSRQSRLAVRLRLSCDQPVEKAAYTF